MRAIVGGYTPPKKTRTNLPLPVVGYESATISLARPRADALTPREESGAEGSRTLDLLNAMRLPGVRHRASPCAKVRNLRRASVPRRTSRMLAHRPTRTEPAHLPLISLHAIRSVAPLRRSRRCATPRCGRLR